jgi:hypothetical protein
MFGNSVWHSAYKNLWFISMKKLANFGYIVDVFSHGNLSLLLKILNWSADESKTPSLSDQLRREGCWKCRPGE